MTISDRRPRVLHIANWYPNRWNPIEGKFVAAQVNCFAAVTQAKLVHVQLRTDDRHWLWIEQVELAPDRKAYYLLTRLRNERLQNILTTALLLCVLITERFWRQDMLHFHIAWPLLAHAHLWRIFVRVPMVISEHWSAYHYNFHLPETAPALRRLRGPFRQGIPVIAVSQSLLADIRRFSGDAPFAGHVLPNFVPLHGASTTNRDIPVLFSVNNWSAIKDPMPMLRGLAHAAEDGAVFRLALGGGGPEAQSMQAFVAASSLADRTEFLGWMTGDAIAAQLAQSDGYLFSSRYETFSVACAEAFGAGVPLLGPIIPAIDEYAGPDDRQCVETRDAEGWRQAAMTFLAALAAGRFDRKAIANRAAERFSASNLVGKYGAILRTILPDFDGPLPTAGAEGDIASPRVGPQSELVACVVAKDGDF